MATARRLAGQFRHIRPCSSSLLLARATRPASQKLSTSFLATKQAASFKTMASLKAQQVSPADHKGYDSEIIDSRLESQRSTLDNLAGELVVPHPRIAEREFVLRPLNE